MKPPGTGTDLRQGRASIENAQFADEVPVIRDVGVTWGGNIWVLRRGETPLSDGPIDMLTPQGRYLWAAIPAERPRCQSHSARTG